MKICISPIDRCTYIRMYTRMLCLNMKPFRRFHHISSFPHYPGTCSPSSSCFCWPAPFSRSGIPRNTPLIAGGWSGHLRGVFSAFLKPLLRLSWNHTSLGSEGPRNWMVRSPRGFCEEEPVKLKYLRVIIYIEYVVTDIVDAGSSVHVG